MEDQKIVLEFLQQRILKSENILENHLGWIQELKNEKENLKKKIDETPNHTDQLKCLTENVSNISKDIIFLKKSIEDTLKITFNISSNSKDVEDRLKKLEHSFELEKGNFLNQFNLLNSIPEQFKNFIDKIESRNQSVDSKFQMLEKRQDESKAALEQLNFSIKSINSLSNTFRTENDNIKSLCSEIQQQIFQQKSQFDLRFSEWENQFLKYAERLKNVDQILLAINQMKKNVSEQHDEKIEEMKKCFSDISQEISKNKINVSDLESKYEKIKMLEKSIADIYEKLKRISN